MHRLFQCRQMTMEFDHEYGEQQRTGWSISLDGHYVVQFERFLLVALLKAFWAQLTITTDR
jgi:hypothetical protein